MSAALIVITNTCWLFPPEDTGSGVSLSSQRRLLRHAKDWHDATGRIVQSFSISTVVALIADITQHIREKSFQIVRYYGWYSNQMRGERKKLEEGSCAGKQENETVDISKLTMIDVADYKPRRIPHPLCRSL